MIGIESGKHFACAAFVRTTVVTIIPSPLQRLHGFGYNGFDRIHLSTWLVLQLEGSVHSVPRDVTLPSLDTQRAARDGAGGRQRGSGHGAAGRERCARDRSRGVHARREDVRAVHVVAEQLVAAHVALRREPVQSGRAGQCQRVAKQVRNQDGFALEGNGLDLEAIQIQEAGVLLHQPWDGPAEGARVDLGDVAGGHYEAKSTRAVLRTPAAACPLSAAEGRQGLPILRRGLPLAG